MVIENTGIPGNPNPAQPGVNPGSASPAATPAVTPAPVAKPAVTPAPQAVQQQGSSVPLAALQEERDKRQALQSELETLRQQMGQLQHPQVQPQIQQADPYQARRAEVEKLWESDPRKAVQAEIVDAFNWYDRVNAQVELESERLAGKYADFNRYRNSAVNYVRTLPYEQRGQQGIVELAYMLVRGQDVDNILKTREQELIQKFQAGQMAGSYAVPGSYATPNTPPAGSVTLSEEQRAVAAMMNLTPEQYASQIKPGGK